MNFKDLTLVIILSLCLLHIQNAQDTFSVIAVDEETGEVGAAGATCVDGIAQWGGIQLLNKMIPGKGGVNAQAWICLNPHINLDNAIMKMEEGLSPEEIIEWLRQNDACFSQNYNPEYRQYGIVDFDDTGAPRAAAFTGTQADDYKGHRVGDHYSIQGNILLGPQILDSMESGFINDNGTLAQKLMSSMQGANVRGADSRCFTRGTSSTSAFLRVVRPDDDPNDPYLELNVLEMPFGEEPIDSLQTLFDIWTATLSVEDRGHDGSILISPNPVQDKLTVKMQDAQIKTYGIYTETGQVVKVRSIDASSQFDIDVSQLPAGKYFLRVGIADGFSTGQFLKTE